MPDTSPWNPAYGRRLAKPRPVRVIAIASGKGGVGKTNVAVNLAIGLVQCGRAVMVLDAALGLGNIDVLLGLHPRFTLSDVIKGERRLEEIVIGGPGGLHLIPASSGVQEMAQLSPAQHAGLIRAFSELGHDVDVLLVDTAAGITDSVITFTRACQEIVVVVCDEPASISDAYALIQLLNREHDVHRFHVLANMVQSAQQGREVYRKLAHLSDRSLDVALDYLGHVPHDDYLRRAVKQQRAVIEAYPRSRAAAALRNISEKIDKWPTPGSPGGRLEFFVERLIQANSPRTEVLP